MMKGVGLIAAVAMATPVAAKVGSTGPATGDVAPAAVFATGEAPRQGTLLKAVIGGREGLFLFDTGGGVTIVTPETARRAGCHPWGRLTGFRATGERLDTPRCDDVTLRIGGVPLRASITSVLEINKFVDARAMPTLSGLIALDLFAGRTITIRPLAHEVVLETPLSAAARTRHGRELPIRAVRDVEGVALSIDAQVPTTAGGAWMELDTGNLGPIMVARHLAATIGLGPDEHALQQSRFALGGGTVVEGPARVSDLILDGDIGELTLRHWDLTLDLAADRAWLAPATAKPTER